MTPSIVVKGMTAAIVAATVASAPLRLAHTEPLDS